MKDIFYFVDSFVYFLNIFLWGESCLFVFVDRFGDEWDIDIVKRCCIFFGRVVRMLIERFFGIYVLLMVVGMFIFF